LELRYGNTVGSEANRCTECTSAQDIEEYMKREIDFESMKIDRHENVVQCFLSSRMNERSTEAAT